MNRSDRFVLIGIVGVILLITLIPDFGSHFRSLNMSHGYLLSFIKFAILASFGECLALRIVSGTYWKKGFGLLPKMVVWGVLGVIIKAAFVVFSTGVPAMLASIGLPVSLTDLATGSLKKRFILAVGISTFLNCIFAPIFMTLHKITDSHIHDYKGTLTALCRPINMKKQLASINWDIQWGFVFKKTIPLFWIPAHTITFLLPADFRVLFAALLGIALGVILAFANLNAAPKPAIQHASTR